MKRVAAFLVVITALSTPLATMRADAHPPNSFSCRASALRTEGFPVAVLNIEPVVANPQDGPCVTDMATALAAAAPPFVSASVLTATTSSVTNTATADVATASVVLGSFFANLSVIHSQAHVECVGGTPVFSSSSSIAIAATSLGNLDGNASAYFDLGLGVELWINRTIVTPTAIIQRAFELHTPLGNVVISEAIADFVPDPCDSTPPICIVNLQGTNALGQKYIEVKVQDPQSGLKSIVVTENTNDVVLVPVFAPGTTAEQTVTATKIDQSKPATLQLRVTDMAGNITDCDPVFTTLRAGPSKAQTFTGIPQAEHLVRVTNGRPGLTEIHIIVNGKSFDLWGLPNGASRLLDVSSAMVAGNNNVFKLWGNGPFLSSADIMISDS